VVHLCQNRVFVIDQGWVVKQEFFTFVSLLRLNNVRSVISTA